MVIPDGMIDLIGCISLSSQKIVSIRERNLIMGSFDDIQKNNRADSAESANQVLYRPVKNRKKSANSWKNSLKSWILRIRIKLFPAYIRIIKNGANWLRSCIASLAILMANPFYKPTDIS